MVDDALKKSRENCWKEAINKVLCNIEGMLDIYTRAIYVAVNSDKRKDFIVLAVYYQYVAKIKKGVDLSHFLFEVRIPLLLEVDLLMAGNEAYMHTLKTLIEAWIATIKKQPFLSYITKEIPRSTIYDCKWESNISSEDIYFQDLVVKVNTLNKQDRNIT